MTEVQALIQTLATVESLTNDIDTLAVFDRQIKDLTAKVKVLKETIANQYGEGKFRGERYGVRVTIENRKGSIDMEALCKAFNISEEQLEQFRGETTAVIKVASIA